MTRAGEVFLVALRLGLTSFGGPIAHLGYFERRYVRELRWLDAEDYASFVALCQVLPGPASSQVGFLVGLHRAGAPGAIAAWLGFTLPSALGIVAFARLAPSLQTPAAAASMHGLKLAAVVVVAQAVWSMARRLNADLPRAAIGVFGAVAMLATGGALAQLAVLLGGAVLGALLCRDASWTWTRSQPLVSRRAATLAFVAFLALLVALPLLAQRSPHGWAAFADAFYRSGALVFGGGHVVLPLLSDALVPGWLSADTFLAGYGAAQAVPGPLFTFAAYLGAVASAPGGTAFAAAAALVAVFLPGLLLAVAGVRGLDALARIPRAAGAIAGINAAVVGLLAAAWYDPVWRSSVDDPADVAIVVAGFALLAWRRTPPIAVVALCVAAAVLRGTFA
ncbi:MAG TPA: chromate efflux transporter [Rhodanobacteraceae bacterium]|nr:chromate efflux transporter [Rhodanobacteraceae bacterium]